MAEVNEYGKRTVAKVDILDPTLAEGPAVAINAGADAWTMPPPPPHGKYDFKLFLAANGFTAKAIDDKKEVDLKTGANLDSFLANIEMRVVNCPNEQYNNSCVFYTASTKVGRGKEISTMMGLYLLPNATVKNEGLPKAELTGKEQCQLLAAWLKKEPIIRGVEIDWSGWSKDDSKEIAKSMTDFPPVDSNDLSKGYLPTIKRQNTRREAEFVNAQPKVKKWIPSEGITGGTSVASKATVVEEVDSDTLAMLQGQ